MISNCRLTDDQWRRIRHHFPSQARACARRGCPCRRATTARAESTNDRENKIGLPCRNRTCWCVRHYCRRRRNYRRLNGKLLRHSDAQHSAGDFDDHYRCLLQSGRTLDLDHEKIGSGVRHFFHRLRSSVATIPCDDWHRSLDRRRRTQIAIGGLIALAVIGYVASQWKKFD
jgi:hypothetical protein